MRIAITALAGFLCATGPAVPSLAGHQGGRFGAGFIAGEPTGISVKGFLTSGNAIQGALAWSTSGNNSMHVEVEYLYHRYSLIKVDKGSMPLFFGIGGRWVLLDSVDDVLGIVFPVGVAYEFDGAPFDVFGQLVPILDLTPDTDFDLEGAVGARFYF